MVSYPHRIKPTGQIGECTMEKSRYELNKELAQMLKGGVIMDVTTPEQARIAEEAGAWGRPCGASPRGRP